VPVVAQKVRKNTQNLTVAMVISPAELTACGRQFVQLGVVNLTVCEVPSFHRGVAEALPVVECDAALVCSYRRSGTAFRPCVMVRQYKKDLGTDTLFTPSATANVGFGTAVCGGAWLMFFVGLLYEVKTLSIRPSVT